MHAPVDLFFEIGVILALGSVLAYVARKFKQPPLLAYIITGILLGPMFLNTISASELIDIFSEFGIAFLLFTVGLELSIREIKEVGKIAAMVGMAQVIITAAVGFMIMQLIGFGLMESIYVAIALTFSSTIIIVKLLSEDNELHSLHGKVALGILLAQDFVAIFALIFMAGLAGQLPIHELVGMTLLKGVGLFIVAYLFTKYALHHIFDRIAHWHELLFISSLAYCFVFAYITDAMGLSLHIGTLIAGVSLATLKYNVDIIGKIRSLRDFFIVLFFVTLGMGVVVTGTALLWPVVILSLFVLLGNPLIVMVIMGLEGYSKRTSLLTGMISAQISEFSLILIALGFALGHVSQDIVSIVTLVGILTITGSAYMINYNDEIYNKIGKYFKIFERKKLIDQKISLPEEMRDHAVLFGYHRLGFDVAQRLQKLKIPTIIVDFNPEVIDSLLKKRKKCMYGDMGDIETLDRVGLKDATLVISSVPSVQDNFVLLHRMKEVRSKAICVVMAEQISEALELYDAGADYVILPHFLGGKHASLLIEEFTLNPRRREYVRKRHLDELIEKRYNRRE
ncbi:MAG: cation:proton antiporter [Candidatus Diapherotrites archaeon]|nr:cation:proton antiporter [Candidatus Diapherotrites archaeon]